MMFRAEITKEEINELEVGQFGGEIRVVDTRQRFYDAMEELRDYSIVGFDTETKPTFRKGVNHSIALVQLANSEVSWLFRINRIGLRRELIDYLEDEAVLKIGAGLSDDMRRLNQITPVNPKGFLDLQKYVEAFNIESKSLKKLAAIVLDIKISKSQQMSNWEADELSRQQEIYAATDAWVCLKIYHRLRTAINEYH